MDYGIQSYTKRELEQARAARDKSEHDQEMLDRVMLGESIRSISRLSHMPSESGLYLRINRDPQLRKNYIQAKRMAMIVMADDLLEIVDDPTGDIIEDKNGNMVVDRENIARSKLRAETRKWYLERLMPELFGKTIGVSLGLEKDDPMRDLMEQVSGRVMRPDAE